MIEQKELLELDLKLLKNQMAVEHNEFRFISTDLGFVDSFAKMEPSLFKVRQPYRIKEARIALTNQGSARVSLNLMEQTFEPNTLSLIAPNSIIQVQEVSSDFDCRMLAFDPGFIKITGKDDPFTHFLQGRRNVLLALDEGEGQQINAFLSLVWEVLQSPLFKKEVIRHLLISFIYNIEYIAKDNLQNSSNHLSRQEEVFQRFISLVNTHNKTERNVGFYAEKLCLTPRYLNTIIRQFSRQTVMEWINHAVTQEAKVLLKHSNLLVYQIADELNFPNPSFFCKFFKRMTGMTPQEYQKLR